MFRANFLFRICLGIIFIAANLSQKISAIPAGTDVLPRQDQADVPVETEAPVLEAPVLDAAAPVDIAAAPADIAAAPVDIAAPPAVEASAPVTEAVDPVVDSQIAAVDNALDSEVEALGDDDKKSKGNKSKDNDSKDDDSKDDDSKDDDSKDDKSKDDKSKGDKSKGDKSKAAGSCDVDSINLPSDAASVLPPPSNGLKLRIITIGRGTQNYSCTDENGKTEPIALGAKATLFDTSCTASKSPQQFAGFARSALDFDGSTDSAQFLDGTRPAVAAQHFFSARKTADFDFSNAASNKLGHFQVVLDKASPAPPGSQIGKNNVGDGAVPWLRAIGTDIGTGAKVEIYRLHTAGGNPSKTCDGKPENFEVQYAAEYWVFQ
ncbi:malate dehydrogenase [Blumeria hordei DH14]|uniref:Malate dehydrogenase n=1 Tax=Blumeria graminis f. sp. hordei (strain DH14) TaxID=546991 RepID=N1JKG5_BLUG1|nr:malate dehydrogenase [Blumeria hordei DH14]